MLRLELPSGETCLIRPSKRVGGLEQKALELVKDYTDRYGIVRETIGGLAGTDEEAAANERLRAIDDDEENLPVLKDEVHQEQGRLFPPDA